jgi:hypothetical protein
VGVSAGGFVKKCASCSKDLPEAALHCVFCGAKQSVAPAATAKTAFGYSANEVLDQLRGPGSPAQKAPTTLPYGAPTQPARHDAPTLPGTQQPSYPQPPPPYGPPTVQGGPATAPALPAAAPHAQPQGAAPLPIQNTYQPPPYQPPPTGTGPMSGGMGINAPRPHTPLPIAPLPSAPYLTHGMRAGAPVEPWKGSLRVMMFIWGAVLLAAFATPLSTAPMTFHWDMLSAPDVPTAGKLTSLLIAGVGLLSIVMAAVPMVSLPRGILAAILGLVGLFVPVFLNGMPGLGELFLLLPPLVLVPGLLIRNEYTDSMLARILITLGVACALLPWLIPRNGEIPLVLLFKALIDAPGRFKILALIDLGFVVVVLMSLLAWMPGPATAAAKVFAWLILAWPAMATLFTLAVSEDLVEVAKNQPFVALMKWAPDMAYSVFIGYGIATVIGKQLE